MYSTKLYFFGTPRIERDDQPVHIRRRKGMALLAYLTISGRSHSREALATLLWPEFDQSRALGNLRREISRLKRDTDLDLFLSDRKQLSQNPAVELWVDVVRFNTLIALVEEHNHFPQQHCQDCLEALTEATELAADDFMAGYTLPDAPDFDEWQFFQAEGLRRSLSNALEKLIEWHGDRSEYREAVDYARRWIAQEPLHEPAHRTLMTLYARDGQHAAALRQYETLVTLLDEELGIEPESETRELHEAIRTRRFPTAPSQRAASGDEYLARGEYLKAQSWFQEHLQQAQAADDDQGKVHALRGLGRASLGLIHVEVAQYYFLEALEQVQARGDEDLALLVLADMAAFFKAAGKPVRAAELAEFVARQPPTGQETNMQIHELLDQASDLPPKRLAEVQERAAQRSLWPTIAELIGELTPISGRIAATSAPDLPVPPTPLIGREKELADIRRLFTNGGDRRLLTLIGPAGIGKTRLALEAASQSKPAFPDGAFFVPLASISSADDIVSAIADGVGFQFFEAAGPEQQLLNYLSQKELLLVMDNFEHVVEGATVTVEILQASPAVRILATSREALNVSGETLYPVQGLSIPTEAELATADGNHPDAVRLFLYQAGRMRPGFEPGVEELRQVGRIVRLVWGMPLALVMAAGWMEVLSVSEIADEIADSLNFLESTARDVPERQRSMRAAFDYSWQRLSASERRAFMRLSVFSSSFNRQAAQSIAGAGLRTLRELVTKSFLAVDDQGRFTIHTLLRQYGLEHLEAAGEKDKSRAAYSDYFLNALQQREPDIVGKRQLEALQQIEADLKNVRAAWQWAVEMGREELITSSCWSLHLAFHVTGRYHEGMQLFRAAWTKFAPESRITPNRTWRTIVPCLTYNASYSGGATPDMKQDTELCLELAEGEEDRFQEANCLLAISCYLLFVEHDPVVAIPYLQRCHDLYRSLERQFSVALTLAWLGWAYGQQGELELSRRFTGRSLEVAEATENRVVASAARHNLGFLAITAGDYAAAEHHCRLGLEVAAEVGRLQSMAMAKLHLGLLCFLKGEVEEARHWAEETLQIGEQINVDVTKSYACSILSLCASLSEDNLRARELSERSRVQTAAYYYQILSSWARAVAYSTHEDEAFSWESLKEALRHAHDSKLEAVVTWLMPVAAILLMRAGQPEHAAELLAIALHHPKSAPDWMGQWSVLQDLRQRLQRELGDGLYLEASQRGRELDLEAVVTALLSQDTD